MSDEQPHGIMLDPITDPVDTVVEIGPVRTSFDAYRDIDAVNWSSLKHLRRSPLHYLHATAKPEPDKHHFLIGRAGHAAILEPETFERQFAIFDGARRAGKRWDLFKSQHGDNILKPNEHAQCLRIRDAVLKNTAAAAYLSDGIAERTVTWTDAATGLRCKGRIDYLSPHAIVDVKVTGDIAENRFGTTAARLGYHGQAAFYREGVKATTGVELPFVIIAVEAASPHDVAVFRLDDDALYAGELEVHRLLGQLKECQTRGTWPGRYDGERTLVLPGWVTGVDEEDVGGLGLIVGDETEAEVE